MKSPKMFVFRISKGRESGHPVGSCPIDYTEIKKIIKGLKEEDLKPIDYENNNHLNFIHSELWNNSILRQGWGIANTDLTQGNPDWIEMYMLSAKIFWEADIECEFAKGRWNILRRMLDIKANDILFIPKTSQEFLDDGNSFVVTSVEKEYYFDYPKDIQDFGHCLMVKNKKVFKYGKETLWKSDFSTPYMWAITEIKPHHSRFEKFSNFLSANY